MPDLQSLLLRARDPALHFHVHAARRQGLEMRHDWPRLSHLRNAVRLTAGLPGHIIECGSYRGGSAAVLGQALQQFAGTARKLYVLDCTDTEETRVRRGLDALNVPARTAQPPALVNGIQAIRVIE